MYFYLFSRHCQHVSHCLKFVHEICGVKNQVRNYCGLNTSHFVLYLFCDYVTSVFWALVAKWWYMNSAVCLPSLSEVILFSAGLIGKCVSVVVYLSSNLPLIAISTKIDFAVKLLGQRQTLPSAYLAAVLTTCNRDREKGWRRYHLNLPQQN